MNLRPVKQVLEELVRYVEPPRGVAIFLTESIPSSASDLNWVRNGCPVSKVAHR